MGLDVSNNLQVHGVCTFNGNVSAPNLYTKTEIDNMVYTQSVINALLAEKADKSHIYERSYLYTKIETNNLLNENKII